MVEIMQGDQYFKPLYISGEDGEPYTADDIEEIHLKIGSVIKTIGNGLEYSAEEKAWLIDFRQEDTLKLPAGKNYSQIRVKFKDTDEVIGEYIVPINVLWSSDKGVM